MTYVGINLEFMEWLSNFNINANIKLRLLLCQGLLRLLRHCCNNTPQSYIGEKGAHLMAGTPIFTSNEITM